MNTMANISEQGHNRNVVNFEKLIIFCTAYGTIYNPNKATLKIAAMQTLLTAAKNSLININTLTPAYKNAVNARHISFKSLDVVVTRANNALKASDTTEETINSAQSIIRKLKGTRATPKKTEEEKEQAAKEGKEIVEISTSQLSYDSKLDNFEKLIKLLTTVPSYNPNETDLKITALTTLQTDLKAKNLAIINTQVELSNARIIRNNLLYKQNTGLTDVANDVKIYIKSLFGATSPQYKQVTALKFSKITT